MTSRGLVLPPPLRSGDEVHIVAPSSPFPREPFEVGVEIIRAAGFRPVFDDGLFTTSRYLAGDDDRRGAELVAAIRSPEARAVWVARGGYGATRLLPLVEAGLVGRNPKWLIGFSDATALHALWCRAGVVSLHGPNVTTLGDWSETASDWVWKRLTGSGGQQRLNGRLVAGRGSVSGVLQGGNISVLGSLVGTGYLPSYRGAIVVLEDVGERPYRLDRTLNQLCQAGAFAGVAGFVIGQLTGCGEPPGQTVDYDAGTVVGELLASRGVPVLAEVAVGHEPSSYPLPLGVPATIDCARDDLVIRGRSPDIRQE